MIKEEDWSEFNKNNYHNFDSVSIKRQNQVVKINLAINRPDHFSYMLKVSVYRDLFILNTGYLKTSLFLKTL